MSREKCTQESFNRDVASHEMEIIRDEGLYRHVRFKRPGTTDMMFSLVTFPGTLVYHGDMGCYVFSRVPDMFQFFRRPGGAAGINPGYWSEKLDATSTYGNGHREFSPARFREWVTGQLDSHEATDELREDVREQVLSRADDGEFWAMHALADYEPCDQADRHVLELDGFDSKDYTFHFLWCCYALVWAISFYDEHAAAARQLAAGAVV